MTEPDEVFINWDEIRQDAQRRVDEAGNETGEGYWVDCDSYVKPNALSPNIERLRWDLPEEVRNDLNWSGDKTYFFIVNVLRSPPPPAQYSEEMDAEQNSSGHDMEEQEPDYPLGSEIAAYEQAFPELAGRELAVVVRAQNSVVAAWLWRKRASTTPLARNPIRVDGWSDAVAIETIVGWIQSDQ